MAGNRTCTTSSPASLSATMPPSTTRPHSPTPRQWNQPSSSLFLGTQCANS